MFKLKEEDIGYLFFLTLTLYISFFYMLGDVALFDLDEGAFSEATREMVASGNYLTTYLNGELRFDKPILIYWLQSFSVHFFGLNEYGVRFPSALFASLWAFSIYFFVRYFYDEKRAFMSAFFMIVSLQIAFIAKAAIADALLNFFIAISMFTIYLYYEKREKKYIYATFLYIALGVLTKGPVAIMIPFIVSGIFFAVQKESVLWLKTIFNPIGILIFIALVAPWYTLEYLDQGEKFINGFFLKHNLSRFSDALEEHNGSYFYFLPVLLLGTLPFTALLFKAFKIDTPLHRFLTIWFWFVFLFFSFSGTKLPHYVIYGYTPLFILMSGVVFKERFWIILPPLLFMFFVFMLPIVLDHITIKDKFFNALMAESKKHFDMAYRAGAFLVIISFILLMIKCRDHLKTVFLTGILFSLYFNNVFIPTVGEIKQEPIKQMVHFIKSDPTLYQKEIYMSGINVPTFSFYLEKITKRKGSKEGDLILTKSTALKNFTHYKEIKRISAYVLIEKGKQP